MRKMQADSRKIIRFSIYLAILVFTVGVDQLTKWLAVTYLKPIKSYPLWQGVFHLTYHENPGMAFGMMQNNRWVFLVFSTLAIVAIFGYLLYFSDTDWFTAVSLLMVGGGGVGNMIDRLFRYSERHGCNAVVDFFDFTLIDFAIFNVADSFVCVGAVLLCLAVLRSEILSNKKAKEKENGHE